MKRWLVLFMVLSLALPILLTACGGGGGNTNTATPTATFTATTTTTATPAATPTPTATATSTATPNPNQEPVKIGAIYPISGPFAAAGLMYNPIVSLVEEQVKNQGGILGGREVKFINGDDAGVVAQAAAQAQKLITADKVVALTFGGVSAASFDAVADVAEKYKVPYVALAALSNMATRKYSADVAGWESNISSYEGAVEFLKPKTVAILGYDLTDAHYMIDGIEGIKGMSERMKAAGIDLVYQQYFPLGTLDFSPYITKIKYLNPDLLMFGGNNAGDTIAMQQQIMELGGYGNMKFYNNNASGSGAAVIKRSASWGTYTSVTWIPGSAEPGMKAFEDAFVQKYGKEPDPQTAFGYNCFWVLIKAMEMAGTDDPVKVAQALHSGNLEWDSAMGPVRIDSNGDGHMVYPLCQIQEGGKLVQVWP